ncbi:PAS domain-containing protein [Emcibacter nanhaiensis]|uniref:PAS domain-containing protein n=4 Tax=Emcibacter nanhaiensis TaxID=1505037 RepID=A0A501PK29_9PROT|nr:PAS domain-containing protein [Emcibacter nanhaiensis]
MFMYPVEFSDLKHDVHKELFQYWNKIRGTRSMPRRKDFEPTEVPNVLKHILMVNVEQATGRYLIRLLGSETVQALGADPTGQYVDSIPVISRVVERCNWIVENKIPYYYQGNVEWSEKNFLEYRSITFPFSDDGETVDIIMAAMVYLFPEST